jgi:DNA-binding response OmpR family regulator
MDEFSDSRSNSLRNRGVTRLLLVSNDYEPAISLKKGLEEYGFKVYYFANVFAALHEIGKTKKVNYDMILFDINPSDTECLLFAKQIREMSYTVKMFLMSSREIEDKVIRNALTAGINEIIMKPISAENLNIVLQDYIDGINNPLNSALKL